MKPAILAALLLSVAIAACGTTEDGDKGGSYSATAKQNYDKGLEELKDDNYPEAIRYFNFVKQKYPFSKYATLAELRLADTQFARGRFLEAIDEYKVFERAHPTHEMVEDGYVGYRVCEAYAKQMPDDFFLTPPSFEKDQSATRDTLRELDAFLDRYPSSKYSSDARKLRLQAVQSLAESEIYVARFYLSRGKPRAAAWRLETVVKHYSGTALDPQVLLLLGDVYEQLGERDKARVTWSKLIKEHGKASEASQAQSRLQRIGPAGASSPGDGGSHG